MASGSCWIPVVHATWLGTWWSQPVTTVFRRHLSLQLIWILGLCNYTRLPTGILKNSAKVRSWWWRLLNRLVFWSFSHLFTLRTPVGRKMRPSVVNHSGPLIRVKNVDLSRAGVERVTRTIAARDGKLVLEDESCPQVENIIWCTGFRPDDSWIELPSIQAGKDPVQLRGVVDAQPGLFFLGRLFQYALSSSMVQGVARDAEYIAERIRLTALHNLPVTVD